MKGVTTPESQHPLENGIVQQRTPPPVGVYVQYGFRRQPLSAGTASMNTKWELAVMVTRWDLRV